MLNQKRKPPSEHALLNGKTDESGLCGDSKGEPLRCHRGLSSKTAQQALFEKRESTLSAAPFSTTRTGRSLKRMRADSGSRKQSVEHALFKRARTASLNRERAASFSRARRWTLNKREIAVGSALFERKNGRKRRGFCGKLIWTKNGRRKCSIFSNKRRQTGFVKIRIRKTGAAKCARPANGKFTPKRTAGKQKRQNCREGGRGWSF